MQFTAKGPDVPESLLEAHEEGRVVFFCGAGISRPAGLPGFDGLVDQIYRLLDTVRTPIEQAAYNRHQFDATLDLLERRLPGQRLAVRTALAKALRPRLRRKGATDTHAALLLLARTREGSFRLVTTNFDRVFEEVAKRTKAGISVYTAPMLPVPKNSRWNGLVHLHGMLPAKPDKIALDRLVVTSGDFGLAYLTERWAARFVSELFRNYVVCFIGYAINDPVLRYMMDALAADRMLGEVTPQAYALGDFAPGQEHDKTIEWEAKGVYPVLYEVPAGTHDHSALHRTLKAWAETFRDGVLGKERIVVDHALANPTGSTRQDDFVGRTLWALSDPSGLPAKRFAEFNPVPPLAWLDALSADRYHHGDLTRFGVPPRTDVDKKLHFSLVKRPAPYTHAPWMCLASAGEADSHWDDVMFHLARWLMRHLNNPALLIWLARHGGHLPDRCAWLIHHALEHQARLEQKGEEAELEAIKANAPDAVATPVMKTLWRLLLTRRVKSPLRDLDLYRWKDRLKRDGLTATVRMELRDLLAPNVVLTEPLRWGPTKDVRDTPTRLKDLVDWELVLAADHVSSALHDLPDEPWRKALPHLLPDFQQLLHDALDLLRELGEADDHSDRSHWDLPSITPHWQNRDFRDWVVLIELLRDSWLELWRTDRVRATRVAQSWFALPYATFKRLALYAASHDNSIGSREWVEWLLADNGWWLWAVETRRETMRLLVSQGGTLSHDARRDLEAGILAGPPRSMFWADIEPERWNLVVDHAVWLRLAKLRQDEHPLGEAAAQRLAEISTKHPEWRLAANESDEFSHWMTGTGDPDYEAHRDVDLAPRSRKELVQWLKQPPPSERPFYEDTWRDVCRTRFFHALFALRDLAQEELWPARRWSEALQVWSEQGAVQRSWRFAAPIVQRMPSSVLQEIPGALTWWLEASSSSLEQHEAVLLELCRRILELPGEDDATTDRPVTAAINHPVGHVTQALINLWFKSEPNDNDGLPTHIARPFTRLCDKNVTRYRHGRVLLASRAIALFRVDRTWAEKHLLNLFDWTTPSEAKAAWEGFLWSPRLYWPLLSALKSVFLECAIHYNELGDHRRQFAAFLTYAALDPAATFTTHEFQAAVGALSPSGLLEVAHALTQAIEGAGDQREEYWRNRVQPFWQHVWPKSRDLASEAIADALARLSVAARGEFPAALSMVEDWLQPFEHAEHAVHVLRESELDARFPEDALRLLNRIIQDQPWAPSDLGACLNAIIREAPHLAQDTRYQRLSAYSRRHGA